MPADHVDFTMLLPVLLLIPIGFAIALPVTVFLCAFSRRVGALDTAGARGHLKELRAVPNTGGIAVFLAVALPLAAGLIGMFALGRDTWANLLPAIEKHWDRLIAGRDGEMPTVYIALAMLGGMTILHVTGLIDDRRSLNPFIKLAVQVVIAAILAIAFNVRLLEFLGPVGSVVATILWIVIITNAINFLDNMDGLAAGVSAVAASFLLAATLINGQWFIAATLALLIGGLIAFLIFNFPPARIFMGDGGSLVVGFLLAVLTTRTTYFHADLGGAWYGVFMPVVVLAIPLYDFATVTFIRLAQRKSPFVGDQQHFSHRLVERGLSRRGAVIVIWCFAAITGIGGISLGQLKLWQAILVFAQTILVLVTIALLEHASRRRTGDARRT